MYIVFYDGGVMPCDTIEIGMNGKTLIINGCEVVQIAEVLRICRG